MQPLPNPGGSSRASAATRRRQPRRYRHRIHSLAYIKLDTTDGGVIRNLSEDGVAIQVVGPLRLGQQLALRFELLNPRLRVEACGCVVWANAQGQAGVEFLDLQAALRRRLKEWIFNQLLATAELAGAESIFVEQEIPPKAQELTFSENARRSILLDPEPADVEPVDVEPPDSEPIHADRTGPLNERAVHVASREAFSSHGIATPWWAVDGLILVCAVLLFLVIVLGMTNTVPAWPVALMLMLAVTGAFAALYCFLFQFWMGATPGEHLARLGGDAAVGIRPDGSEEERPRFR